MNREEEIANLVAELGISHDRLQARVAELEQANFELKRFAEAIALENDTLRKALKKFTD